MTVAKPQRKIIKQKHGGALTPFPKGVSGNPAGGPRSKLRQLKEELALKFDFNLSTKDVKDLLKLLVFAPKEELEKLKNNPHTPVIILNYITALYADIKKGQINAAKDLIEIEYGKATQKVEDVTPQVGVNIKDISPEKLFETTSYVITMFDVDYLEKLKALVENQIKVRMSNNAKIIEG